MKKQIKLSEYFIPTAYKLSVDTGTLVIDGKKMGRPNKRIIFNQKGLKVREAKITRLDKKGALNMQVARINHLPTFQQVRLHTSEMLYPGNYQIELSYLLPQNFDKTKPRRTWLPSIDEPEAWANSTVLFDEGD